MDTSKYKKINMGQSGADVFELDGSRILKHVVRNKIDNGMFDTYVNEALFYQAECPKEYLPEVYNIEILPDEIVLVMKKYQNPDKEDFGEGYLRKVSEVLAQIHSGQVPEFLKKGDINPDTMSKDEISSCVKGWQSVLAEHPGEFDDSLIDTISHNINDIIEWHASEKKILSHGDFHWDNILTDENGTLIVCDWQGVCISGASNDLSFFMSRLGADGIHVDGKRFLTWYALEYNRLTGECIEAEELERHIKTANLITSFRYWHLYLHGNDTERVREIYDKMKKSNLFK